MTSTRLTSSRVGGLTFAEEPGLTVWLRPVLTTPWTWALDRASREAENGATAFDFRTFYLLLFRLGVEELEGAAGAAVGPEGLQEELRIIGRTYQAVRQDVVDRLPPEFVYRVGREVAGRQMPTAPEKKTSGSPSGGASVSATTEPGTARAAPIRSA